METDLAPGSSSPGGGAPSGRRLVIVAPMYGGNGTGAATYYQILVEHLGRQGWDTIVISERAEREDPEGLVALFPRRSGTAKRKLRSYVVYARQNVRYLQLPGLLRELAPDAVLVHSSFYNFPGIFPQVMKRAFRTLPDTRFIIDVRDQLLPRRRAVYVSAYDAVIACAANVQRHLDACGVAAGATSLIPVIQEPLDVEEEGGREVRRRLDLGQGPFLFYAGLVKEEKRVDLLIDAFVEVVRPARPEMKLVLAGLRKARTRSLKRKLAGEDVVYLGNVPRDTVLALMSEAELCVNPAPKEGLPRSSLEAIALGKPVLLPPNVPEFEEHCAEFVSRAGTARELGVEILDLLDHRRVPEYPVERHFTSVVIQRYVDLLTPPSPASRAWPSES